MTERLAGRRAAPAAASRALAPAPAWVLILLVAAVGINMRATFGAVPPLLSAIGDDLALNATLLSLLTAVPVLVMGLCAPIGHVLGARIGPERAILLLLALLTLGAGARILAFSAWTLMVCVVVIGMAMGASSALLPGFISHHLSRIRGTATGAYSLSMAMGVAFAAWVTLPLADALGGWRPSLAAWGVAALATAVWWLVLLRRMDTRRRGAADGSAPTVRRGLPWRSPTAWWVAVMTAVAMLIGFSGVGWIAPILESYGASPREAANVFAGFQLIQILAMVTLPPLTDLTRDRRPLMLVPLLSAGTGITLLMVAPDGPTLAAALLFGFGAGGAASLSLVLIQDASRNQSEAGRLGAMVMLVANGTAALGPLALGSLRDLTGGFTAGLGAVLAVVVLGLAILPGLRPGRHVEQFAEATDSQ